MQATLRNLVQLAGAAASGILGANMSGVAIATAAPEGSVSSAPPVIERFTIRRRGVGLRGYDPERAFAGFTLFAPLSSSNKTVYLVDMLGKRSIRGRCRTHPANRDISPSAARSSTTARFRTRATLGRLPIDGGAALEMDWKGRILWEVNHPDHNHDGIRLKNGNVLLICQKPLRRFAAKVSRWPARARSTTMERWMRPTSSR